MKKLATLIICASLTLGAMGAAYAGMFSNSSFPTITLFNETDPLEELYGPKPTASFHDEIVHMHQRNAIDPESVHITPQWDKVYGTRVGAQSDGLVIIGWAVPYTINAKNRMGGYAGPEERIAYFFEGELVAGCLTPEATVAKINNTISNYKNGLFSPTPTSFCVWNHQAKAMNPEHYQAWCNANPVKKNGK